MDGSICYRVYGCTVVDGRDHLPFNISAFLGDSPIAVDIGRELIRQKLSGQEEIIRDKLRRSTEADGIANFQSQLSAANTSIPFATSKEKQQPFTGRLGRMFLSNFQTVRRCAYRITGGDSACAGHRLASTHEKQRIRSTQF